MINLQPSKHLSLNNLTKTFHKTPLKTKENENNENQFTLQMPSLLCTKTHNKVQMSIHYKMRVSRKVPLKQTTSEQIYTRKKDETAFFHVDQHTFSLKYLDISQFRQKAYHH